MVDTEKMLMTNTEVIFIVDKIVFARGAHHPEEQPQEIWEFINFHQVFWIVFWIRRHKRGVELFLVVGRFPSGSTSF